MDLSSLEPFDYYKHLKNTMKSAELQCKDMLNPSTIYCLQCHESSCSSCNNSKHQDHNFIHKLPYYTNKDNILFTKHFGDLDTLIANDSEAIDIPRLRNKLSSMINSNVDSLKALLNQVKEFKLKEVDDILTNSESCVESIKGSIQKIKDSIKGFIKIGNTFTALTPHFDLENENELVQKDGFDNTDLGNCAFLMRYEVLDSATAQNDQVATLIKDINQSALNYQTNFQLEMQTAREALEKLLTPADDFFKYPQLTQNFYREIHEKVKAYNDLLGTLKKNVYDSVQKHNTFEEIEKMNILAEAKNKQRIDSILNADYDPNGNGENGTQMSNNNTITGLGNESDKKSMSKLNQSTTSFKSSIRSSKVMRERNKIVYPSVTLSSIDEVTLNYPTVQKYFSYQMLDLLNAIHQLKKKKRSADTMATFFDDDVDIAKPIAGTNEIQVYDKANRTMQKRKVPFDKSRHHYTYFLNGARHILIKDKLYITGGVDKERNESKACFVYLIKQNEIKLMPEMINSRCYHSIEFLEFYKSILVIGGENNPTCELFDMYSHQWKTLPNLNYPRANSSLFLDRISNTIYSCFGITGPFAKSDAFSDLIECIELKKANNGWFRVDYVNRTEMDFKNALCKIFPIDHERILVYGASGIRESKKKSAIFALKNSEMIKIDSKTYNEMRASALKSKRLTDIISKFV